MAYTSLGSSYVNHMGASLSSLSSLSSLFPLTFHFSFHLSLFRSPFPIPRAKRATLTLSLPFLLTYLLTYLFYPLPLDEFPNSLTLTLTLGHELCHLKIGKVTKYNIFYMGKITPYFNGRIIR